MIMQDSLINLKTLIDFNKMRVQKKGIFFNNTIRDFLIIAPDSDFRVIWDVLCMFLIIYEMIMIPFRLSFEEENNALF